MKKNKFSISLPTFHFNNRTCAQLFALWLSACIFILLLVTCTPSIPVIFIMVLFFWLGTGSNEQKKQSKQQKQYNDGLLDDDWSE